MSRGVIAGTAACAIACACATAAAQPAGGDRPVQLPGEPPPAPGQPAPGEPQPPQPAPAEPAPPAPTEPAPAPAPTVSEPVFAPPASEPAPAPNDDDDAIGDQLIGGQLGIAAGGRTTAGGLRITAHYLYQLTDEDWFDGTASFTFGSGAAACFRDRSDDVICDHGLASGGAVEVTAAVRRMFAPQGRFRPFARVGVGLALVQFTGDDLAGLAIPLHVGAGLRAQAAPVVAVVVLADAMLGLAAFGGGVGGEPQAGLAITVGAEVRLR